jgi:hypothetical protein
VEPHSCRVLHCSSQLKIYRVSQLLVHCVFSKLWSILQLESSEEPFIERRCFQDLKKYLAENTDCARYMQFPFIWLVYVGITLLKLLSMYCQDLVREFSPKHSSSLLVQLILSTRDCISFV